MEGWQEKEENLLVRWKKRGDWKPTRMAVEEGGRQGLSNDSRPINLARQPAQCAVP